MPEQKITLIINEDGAISAKIEGFIGDACLDALDEILEGDTILESMKTHEFDEKVSVSTSLTIKGGRS